MLMALLFSVLTELTRVDCSPVYVESRAIVMIEHTMEGSKLTLQGGIVVEVCESPKEIVRKIEKPNGMVIERVYLAPQPTPATPLPPVQKQSRPWPKAWRFNNPATREDYETMHDYMLKEGK